MANDAVSDDQDCLHVVSEESDRNVEVEMDWKGFAGTANQNLIVLVVAAG